MIPCKQFIVCGASTGGKSTFSHELVKRYHVQHIQIDPIIEAFEDVFPHLGITHKANSHKEHKDVCQKFKPFLFRMIDGLDADNFVIEGFRMPLSDLHKKYGSTHKIFVFGFPNQTPAEKIRICREYDIDNWTNFLSDEELWKIFAFLISESQYLQKECIRLGVPFFDTGNNYHEQIHKALGMSSLS